MSWEQYQTILETRRRERAIELAVPPEVCPFDGEPLEVHPNGSRNCPLGNYHWNGEPKLL